MEISNHDEAQPGAVIDNSPTCDNEEIAVESTPINSAKVLPAKVNSSNISLKEEGKVINSVCKKISEKNFSVKNSVIEIKKQHLKKKASKKLISHTQSKLIELDSPSNCINKTESKQKVKNTVGFVVPQILKPSKVTDDFPKDSGQSRGPKDSVKPCISNSIVIEEIIYRNKPWNVLDSIRPGTSKDYTQPILPKEPSSTHKGHSQLLESKYSSKTNSEKEHPKHGSSKDASKLEVSKDFPGASSNRAIEKCSTAQEANVPSLSRRKYLYLFRSRSHHVVVKKHGVKVYKCDICNGEYRQNFSLKRHFLRSHVNAKYVSKSDILNCKIREGLLTLDSRKEETSSRKKSKVENEIFLENNDNRAMPNLFKCHICSNVAYDLEKEIKAHYKRQHSEGQKKKFPCDTCGAIFVRKQFLIKHRATHRAPAFECLECDIHFSSKSEYKKHALSHSNNKSVCRTCLKTFSSTANRKRHEKLHQGPIRKRGRGKLPKKPESSNKQSPSKPVAVAVVQPLKLKICPVCKKAFSTVVAMLKHRSKKHPILPRRRRTQRTHVPKVMTKKDLAALARKSEYDFYCNVSQRIADNLLHHLDGKAKTLSLKKYNFNDHTEPSNYYEDLVCLPWSSFNFPNGFDVDYALRNRGQEIKQKPPENLSVRERSLYATGLNKVQLSSESSSNCNGSIWSESSNESSEAEWHSESCVRDDIKDLSLEERKKLIGKELVVVCLCTICKESFTSYNDYDKHCENNHPNIDCSCIEIEGDTRTPPQVPVDLCRQSVTSDGVFFSCSVPPPLSQANLLRCTKCKTEFNSSMELHKHILDCGGNECAVAKYVRTQKKRIKRTMKNRMDLSAKQSPTKRLSEKNHFYKNGRLQTTSMKCDKNYFSTKPAKQMKSTLNLKQKPLLKQKVECPTCKRIFRSEGNLKSHVILCFKRTLSYRKSETNNHNSRKKVMNSSFHNEQPLSKDVTPNEVHETNNESAGSQKVTVENPSNFQNIPVINCNSNLSKNISDVNSSEVNENSSPLTKSANSFIPNGTGAEESAVDLTVKSQVCTQKSPSTITLSSPKQPSALDKAMEAATEFARSMPKMKRMSPISSLSETVKRLTKQLSGRITGLETFNLDVSPPKKSPRKQVGPSGLKNTTAEPTKNDPKSLKKIEHQEKETTTLKSNNVPEKVSIDNSSPVAKKVTSDLFKSDYNTPEKVHTENASLIVKKLANNLAVSLSNNLNNNEKSLKSSETFTTPDAKIPKLLIKISAGTEEHKSASTKELSDDSNKMSGLVKADPPNLQSNAKEDTAVVSTPDVSPKNDALLGNSDNESKKKDFSDSITENPSTNTHANTEFQSVNVSLNELATSNANNKSDGSFSSIDLSDTQSDSGSTDKFPALSSSVLFLPTKKQTKSRQSSGSQGRISPSLESIVNSIKQKLHSQELDPPQQCVSWLEDEKFVIPSSSPKLILPVNINSTSEPLPISKKLHFQSIETPEVSKTPGNDEVFLHDEVEPNPSSVVKPVLLNKKPPPAELLNASVNELSDAFTKSKESSVAEDVEETGTEIEVPELLEKDIKVASVLKKKKTKEQIHSQKQISSTIATKKISRMTKKSLICKSDSGGELALPNSVYGPAIPEQNSNSDIMLPQQRSSQINSTLSDAMISESPSLDSNKVVSSVKELTAGKSCKSSLAEKNKSKIDVNNSIETAVLKDKDQTISNHNASLPLECSDSSKVNSNSKGTIDSSISTEDFTGKMKKTDLISGDSVKKRGRPRKNIPLIPVTSKPIEVKETVVIKRKPGRPFKRKPGRKGFKGADNKSLNPISAKITKKQDDQLVSPSVQVIDQSEERNENDNSDKNIASNINSSKKTDASPEVRTIFGQNLASKMKEKMAQSFKSVPIEKSISSDLSSNAEKDTIVESVPNNDIASLIKDLSAEADSISNKLSPLDSQTDLLVKLEQECKEDAKKHFCPFCLGEFAYLTNYRRHLKLCKERLNSNGLDYDSVPQCSSGLLQFLPKKDEVEASMLDLARHQSRQSQILKETEDTANSKKGFRTYSCRFCHRIYLSLFQFLQHQMNSHKIIKGEVDLESRNDDSMYQALAIKAEDAMSVDMRSDMGEDSRYLSEENCDSETSNMESETINSENAVLESEDKRNSENEQEFIDQAENGNEQPEVNQSFAEVNTENEITLETSTDATQNEDHASVQAISNSETLDKDQTEFVSSKKEEVTSSALTPLAKPDLDTKAATDSVPSSKDTLNVSSSEFNCLKDLNTTADACVSFKGMSSKRGRRRRWKGQVHNFVRRKASAANLNKKLKLDILNENENALLLKKNPDENAIVIKTFKNPLLNPKKKNIFHKIKRKFIRKKAKNCVQEVTNISERVKEDNLKTESDLKVEKLNATENSASVVSELKLEDKTLGKMLKNHSLGSINRNVRVIKKGKKIMKFGIKRTLSSVKLNPETKVIKPRGRPRKVPVALCEPPVPAAVQKVPPDLEKEMTPKRRYVKKSVMFSPPSTSKNHASTSFQSKTRNAKGLQSFPTIDDSSNDDEVVPTEAVAGPPQKKKRAKICPVCKKKFPATLLRNRHIQLIHSRKTPIDIASISPENLKKKRSINETADRNTLKRVCKKPSLEKRPKTELN